MLIIACLSQKGGVGKSTFARLIARTYAEAKWRVKIADFNVKQKTSVDWAAIRMGANISPEIPAEPFTDINKAVRSDSDLLVLDGRPESDDQTLHLAREANLVVIPCGVSIDDLMPQVRFAQELRAKGLDRRRTLFVLNKVTDSEAAISEAKRFIEGAGFRVAKYSVPMKTAYLNAHNTGRTLSETDFDTLNNRANAVAQEIIDNAADGN